MAPPFSGVRRNRQLRANGRRALGGSLGREALEYLSVGSDRHDGGDDRDPVLLGQIGLVADIHLEQRATR